MASVEFLSTSVLIWIKSPIEYFTGYNPFSSECQVIMLSSEKTGEIISCGKQKSGDYLGVSKDGVNVFISFLPSGSDLKQYLDEQDFVPPLYRKGNICPGFDDDFFNPSVLLD